VCGIPEVLYTDHGSDVTSRHLEQVGADLKIRLIFSMAGKPRGRGWIERCFATPAAPSGCFIACWRKSHGFWKSTRSTP
jgi:transposase InsO family protein